MREERVGIILVRGRRATKELAPKDIRHGWYPGARSYMAVSGA